MLPEILRRPSMIAAVAGALLVSNLVALAVLSEGDTTVPGIEDGRGALAEGSDDTTSGDGDGGGDGGDASGNDGDGTDGTDGTDSGDSGDGSNDGGDTDGGGTDGGDSGSGEDSGDSDGDGGEAASEAPRIEFLTSPTVGTYEFDASGTWQLEGDVLNELPDRAEGTVSARGVDRWGFTVVAGPRYSDSYQFSIDEEGLDWTAWSLARTFPDGKGGEAQATTTYTCSSTDAFFVANSEKGRNIEHGCNGPLGLRSVGPVISQGTKVLDLADGTEATTIHLRYEYSVSSDNVTGSGTLELWMDPATGLRVQEVRKITSTTTLDDGSTSTYEEDIRLTLRSLDPM